MSTFRSSITTMSRPEEFRWSHPKETKILLVHQVDGRHIPQQSFFSKVQFPADHFQGRMRYVRLLTNVVRIMTTDTDPAASTAEPVLA